MKALFVLLISGCCHLSALSQNPLLTDQTRELLSVSGFFIEDSLTDLVKTEFLKWLAVPDNQICFLANLVLQLKDQDETLSAEFLRNLNLLKKALKQWTMTFITHPERRTSHLMLIPAYISRYDRPKNVEEEIEFLREEVAELKEEAAEKLIRAALEAAGAGITAANGALGLAGGTLCLASNDVIKGCKMYNDALELERRIEDLEQSLGKEDEPEINTSKMWWEFWK